MIFLDIGIEGGGSMANVNTIAYQSPQFSILSESQMKDLHLAALEVLRHTGLRFYHKGAVELLKKAGAFVSDGNLVKIPDHKRALRERRP